MSFPAPSPDAVSPSRRSTTLRAAAPIAASFAISAAFAAASVDEGPLVPLAVAVTFTLATVAHAARASPRRGPASTTLWQLVGLSAGVLGAALFAGAGALVWAFAGYCEDSCDPPPSRTTGLIVAVVFFLIAVGVGVGATLLWRRLQRARMRSEASTSWAALMAPALAAWLAVPIWVLGS